MTKPLNEELIKVATTPQLERIANELERTGSELFFSFQEYLRIDCKHELTSVDLIKKKKLLDEIGKLILKL